MSTKKSKTKKTVKKTVICCPKDLAAKNSCEKKPAPAKKPPPVMNRATCEIHVPPPLPFSMESLHEIKLNQPYHKRTEADKQHYLEQQVVPILIDGMLALAQHQPNDPITFLSKYWLKEEHLCKVKLPQNLL